MTSDDDLLSIKAATAHLKFLREPRPINLSRTSTNILQIRDDRFSGSDITSLEYEQNSETESCDQNRELSDSNDEAMLKPTALSRPRILKPVEVNLDSAGDEGGCSSPEPRGVRGRKKPAYVSPYKMTSRNASPKSVSPVPLNRQRQVDLIAKPSPSKLIPKNQTIIAKTHVIMSKANLTNKINSIKSGLAKPGFIKAKTCATERRTMCKSKTYTEISSHCETTTKTLERQGTFVKEEGSDLNVPVVTSAPPTPAKTSKLPLAKIPPPKSAPGRTSLVSKLRIPLQKSATQSFRAPSTAAPQSTAINKRGVYKSPSVPAVPQRSNSNVSIKSTTNRTGLTGVSVNPAPKRDITSRIAGLWKKVDENKKQQQQHKKDTRIWIGAKKQGSEEGSRPPAAPYQLIRSSTFDASPEEPSTVQHSQEFNLPIISTAKTLKSPSSGKADGRSLFSAAGIRRN